MGGVVGGGYFSYHRYGHHPDPQNLCHIYDTLTFMFECQGWGWCGGSKKMGKKFTDSKLNVEHPQHLSHIYKGWGGGGLNEKYHPHHTTHDTQTQMSRYHRYDLNFRGGVVGGGLNEK